MFDHAIQFHQSVGAYMDSGKNRCQLAGMYVYESRLEKQSQLKRSVLGRAEAYAAAALRDFQRYPGRAAELEASTHSMIREIKEELAKLS